MRKTLLILFLIFSHYQIKAQFTHTGIRAESVNIKFYSKDETLYLAKQIGDLTKEQTEKIYLTNLQINRRITTGSSFKNGYDFTALKNSSEKGLAYKKILTPEQFDKYQHIIKNSRANLANTNVQFYDNSDFDKADNRISSTK